MNLKTRYNFWKIKQDFAPSKVFKRMLRRNLNQAWNAQYGRATWLQIGLLHKGAALAVVATLLIGSTGAYAYVSPEVTEGTALYPLKQAVETVEEAIKITPEAKAKFYLKQIKRREREKEKLAGTNIQRAHSATTTILRADKIVETETEDKKQAPKLRHKKNKFKAVEVRIEKTEQFIERTEERLEKAGRIIEKIGSKNEKLREDVKNRLQIRVERRKRRLEEKLERQKKQIERFKQLNSEEESSVENKGR